MKEEEVEHWRMKEEEEVEHWRLREKRSRTRRRQRKRRTSFTGVQVVQPVPKVQHSVSLILGSIQHWDGFQHGQSFLAPEFCWFDLRLVHHHCVEVDPKVSETVHVFYDFSTEGDCWHCLSYSFVVEGAPQGLCLAWTDFGLCLLAPVWHL